MQWRLVGLFMVDLGLGLLYNQRKGLIKSFFQYSH